MTRKIVLTIVILLLLVISGGLITGSFDIQPVAAVGVALVVLLLAAYVIRNKNG